MHIYDIAIIGGGIAGASLAWFLKGKRSTVILERESAPGYHSTGRSAAEFVLRYNSPEVCALAAISRDFFETPPDGFSETHLISRRGGVVIANHEKESRLREQFAQEVRHHPLTLLERDEALDMVPILNPDYLAAAYFDPDFWDIDVESLLQGYLKGARHAGVELRTNSEVLSAVDRGEHWELETRQGKVEARVIVNASGGWADQTAALAGVRPMQIVPHRRTAILVDAPEGVDVRWMPEINELDEEFYLKPDAGRLLVSPADETPCEPADVQPEDIDIAWAAHHLEGATTVKVSRIGKSWAGMRSFSPDRLPVIGHAADHPRFFWLAGQGGYGILSSPALGSLASALLTEKPTPDGFAANDLGPLKLSPLRYR